MACDIVKYVAVWYWKSNENPCSMNEIETWQNYSAIDNEMIENEFKKNAKHIILDEYIIDFEKLIQTNKDHSNGKKERPVKRILEDVTTHPRNINYKERLYSTELPEKTIGNINWNCWYEEKSLKRMPPNCGKFIREWLYQLLPEYIEWTPEDYQQYVTALARGFVQTKHPQYISDVIQNPRKVYPSGSNVLTKLPKKLVKTTTIEVQQTIREFPHICGMHGYNCPFLPYTHTSYNLQEQYSSSICENTQRDFGSLLSLELAEFKEGYWCLQLSTDVGYMGKNGSRQYDRWNRKKLGFHLATKRESSCSEQNSDDSSQLQSEIFPSVVRPMGWTNAFSCCPLKRIFSRKSNVHYKTSFQRLNLRSAPEVKQPFWYKHRGKAAAYQYFDYIQLVISFNNRSSNPIAPNMLMHDRDPECRLCRSSYEHLGRPFCFCKYSQCYDYDGVSNRPFLRLELNDQCHKSTSKSIWVIYPRSTGYLTDDSEYLQLLECAHQISHETNTPLVTTIEDYPTILKRNGGSTAGYRRARGTWQITEEHKMEWLEYVVKEAAQGIIEEGEKVGKLIAAKYIADALLQAFKDDDLWRCCIYLYTLESFLYRCINRALRDEDITKLKSLGPYCYLLHWSLIGDQSVNVSNNKEKQLFTGIVYRGMNLEEWAIESYKTAKGSYRSWPAFTSTTKNREIASLFGNVLFIIDIQNDVFISQDISMVSQMKDEEEVLLRAGTIFKILDIDSTNTCSSTTCIDSISSTSSENIRLYKFDGNTYDTSLKANGNPIGTNSMPVYHYGGYAGTAIALNSYDQQYVNIPYINISHQSFTLEVWFILLPPTGISINQTDFGIFGQCSTDQKCFLVTVRKGHIHVSFDSLANNVTLISSSLVAYYYWVHIAVVYDANALQQRLYINGRLEIISTGIVSPYDGLVTGASAWIGRTKSAAYSLSYFNG
ncbi:unnamed protein product [Rotaria sp. Silwood1]|nr:unnamed protein product [Rotaria sp. Silwood1]